MFANDFIYHMTDMRYTHVTLGCGSLLLGRSSFTGVTTPVTSRRKLKIRKLIFTSGGLLKTRDTDLALLAEC